MHTQRCDLDAKGWIEKEESFRDLCLVSGMAFASNDGAEQGWPLDVEEVMGRVFLLISRPRRDLTQMRVTCALPMQIENLHIEHREFSNARDLEKELCALGIPGHELQAPQQVFHTGLPTFIPVSEEIARRLGVLK